MIYNIYHLYTPVLFLGILSKMENGSFIVHLFILHDVLSTINILCNIFQDKSSTLGKANIIINSAIKSLKSSRSTKGFNDLWQKIQNFTEKYNISINDSYQKQSTY